MLRPLITVLALVGSILTFLLAPSSPASALTTAAQVSAGGETTCAVMTGGNAYCWGDNTYGQLGNGTTTSSATPVLVSGGLTWASISTEDQEDGPFWSTATTCGVTTTGAGYCWGHNDGGEVGDGTNTQRTSPTAISGGYTWKSISVGYQDVCGVTTSNAGYCWGLNASGEIGNGNTFPNNTPTAISGGYSWSAISAGARATCGVTTGGAGYCWGTNINGELGTNDLTSYPVPTAVSGGYTWAEISIGASNSCGVTTTGVGYCWGLNYPGEVGDGTHNQRLAPTTVSGGYTWASITEAWGSTCGLTTAGAAYCWGANAAGADGNNTTTQEDTPVAVSGGLSFSSVVSGGDQYNDTNCGLAQGGIVYCWGGNNDSQIGDGTTTQRLVPTEASLLFASVNNTTLSVTVDPSFTFTVANQASACNGESNFVSGAGTASTVALGHLAAGANVSGGQALTVVGNAGNGFVVYVAGNHASQDLRSSGHNWTDVAGSYGSPAVLGVGERFGYTYKDSTSSSSVTNPSSANFVALTNATTNAVMGSSSSVTGSGCVSYDAQTSATTPAASYTATVVYTAVPAF